MSNETLATSYGGAVTAALTMAFGLSSFINRRFEPARAKQLLRFVAFPTAVTASSLNCYIGETGQIETDDEAYDWLTCRPRATPLRWAHAPQGMRTL